MNKEKLILKNYAEGKISTREFWDLYLTNIKISKILNKDKTCNFKTFYSPGIIESHFNVDNVFDRYGLYENIKAYLIRNNIECEFFNEDEKYILLVNKIQPSYVDVRDQIFWDNVIDDSPTFNTNKEKIASLKEKVKNLFMFDSTPPKWIQSPEWPIENNKPLKFIKQTQINNGYEYSFINVDTNLPKIINQFY